MFECLGLLVVVRLLFLDRINRIDRIYRNGECRNTGAGADCWMLIVCSFAYLHIKEKGLDV